MSQAYLRRPLITGAARGLGRAFVTAFLEAGAERVYAGVRGAADAAALAALDPRVTPMVLDVAQEGQAIAAAQAAADVTVLINNAGIEKNSKLLSAPTTEAARAEMEVNYFGLLHMVRAFTPVLARNDGAMVNVLSIAALGSVLRVGSYSATKAAARSLTQGLRNELAGAPPQIFAVYPAGYDTDMADTVRAYAKLYPPRMLTDAVLKALADGGPEEIHPDPTSQKFAELALSDPEEMLRMLGGRATINRP